MKAENELKYDCHGIIKCNLMMNYVVVIKVKVIIIG